VGNVDRLTVAVMIDGIYKEIENAEGILEEVYEPRPQDDIDRITAIVKSAVGFDSQRNDQIEVVNIPFDRTTISVEQDKLDQMIRRDFYYDVGKKILYILLALAILFYVRKKIKRLFASLRGLLPGTEIKKTVPSSGEEGQESEPDEEPPLPSISKKKRRLTLVDQMQEVARERPEEVARAIKTMMFESGDK
jgi:flagellar M-ring protein FliF